MQGSEKFGQGGNCQMMGNFAFDTGLLVADTDEAYIINCAGKEWAAKKVSDVYAISNRYQITNDWNLSSLKNDNDSKQNFNELFEDTSKSGKVSRLGNGSFGSDKLKRVAKTKSPRKARRLPESQKKFTEDVDHRTMESKLKLYKKLRDSGKISKQKYQEKKKELLKKF